MGFYEEYFFKISCNTGLPYILSIFQLGSGESEIQITNEHGLSYGIQSRAMADFLTMKMGPNGWQYTGNGTGSVQTVALQFTPRYWLSAKPFILEAGFYTATVTALIEY